VIVINAAKVSFSGTKLENKEYVRYTGYPGGQRSLTAQELLQRNPERVIEKAIKGMLPKNTLGRDLFRNVKVFAGTDHKHEAQNPEAINLKANK
jgi:large subunit ribosomal protein L13